MEITAAFALCPLESQAQEEASCHVVKTQAALGRGRSSKELRLPAYDPHWLAKYVRKPPRNGSSPYPQLRFRCLHFRVVKTFLLKDSHLFIHFFIKYLSSALPKTLLRDYQDFPKERRRVGFFAHVSSHLLVATADVSKTLRLFPETNYLSLYPPVIFVEKWKQISGSSPTTYLPSMA